MKFLLSPAVNRYYSEWFHSSLVAMLTCTFTGMKQTHYCASNEQSDESPEVLLSSSVECSTEGTKWTGLIHRNNYLSIMANLSNPIVGCRCYMEFTN